MVARANNETEIDTNLINKAEKLLIYSIGKIYTNLSKFKYSIIEKITIEARRADKLANSYIYALQETLRPLLYDCFTNKVVSSLLPKLLFRDLNALCNFCQYDFHYRVRHELPLPSNDPEEIKKYFEKIKISLLVYFKTLLKEFNLMKFYRQAADMSGIKVNDINFYGINKKTTVVNDLLKHIRDGVRTYSCKIFFISNVWLHYKKGYKNLPSVSHFISFYYWIKIANSLLKQYKQTISDNELRRKINIRLYRYLSVVVITICIGEAAIAAYDLITYAYLRNYPIIEPINTNDVKKLLGKISKVLNDIYFIVEYNKENMPFLVTSSTTEKSPYINGCVEKIIDLLFLGNIDGILRELKNGLDEQRLSINSKNESEREDMCCILRTIDEIDSIKDKISVAIRKF